MQHLPFFPLPICVFEEEMLPLHVFEPRYRLLVHDCLKENAAFGIPAYIAGKKPNWGTALVISKVLKTYPDGRLDIMCQATQRFQITEWFDPENENKYHHGLVHYQPLANDEYKELKFRLHDLLNEFYQISGISFDVHENDPMQRWIHKCGLELPQEYELLKMNAVAERQLYIIHHLKNLVSALQKTEQARSMVRLNGHPKKFNSPL